MYVFIKHETLQLYGSFVQNLSNFFMFKCEVLGIWCVIGCKQKTCVRQGQLQFN